MLHLAGFDTSEPTLMALLLDCVNSGDAVVFLDDGLAWRTQSAALAGLAARGAALYALDDDAPPAPLHTLDPAGLVALSEQHPASSAWYP